MLIRFGRVTILVLAVFTLLACSIPGGKPSTSAPRLTDDLDVFWEACNEKVGRVDGWEQREKRKVEDEWIDGKRGLWQSGAKIERIEEDADALRSTLRKNCGERAKASEPSGEVFPTVTPRKARR